MSGTSSQGPPPAALAGRLMGALPHLAEIVAADGGVAEAAVEVLLLGVDLAEAETDAARVELSRWGDILARARRDPQAAQVAVRALVMRGVAQATAQLAVDSVLHHAEGSAPPPVPGGGAIGAIVTDVTQLALGELPAGTAATAAFTVRGGPGRVVPGSEAITVTPQQFGPHPTRLTVRVTPPALPGVLWDRVVLLSNGGERVVLDVVGRWHTPDQDHPALPGDEPAEAVPGQLLLFPSPLRFVDRILGLPPAPAPPPKQVPKPGTLRWRRPTGGGGVRWVAVAGDTVYASSDYGVYALRAATGDLRWKHRIERRWVEPMVTAEDTVYAGSEDVVYALRAATGDQRWQYAVDYARSVAVAGDTVYAGSEDGVYALRAATGDLRWKYAVGGCVWSVAVAGDTVHASVGGHLYALRAADGQLRWNCSTSVPSFKSMVTAGKTLYGNVHRYVCALRAADGQLCWKYAAGDTVSSVAVAGDTVYVGSEDGHVYALRAADGQLRWKYAVGGCVWSVAVAGDTVYAGVWFTRHDVYALRAADGQLRWKYAAGGDIEDWVFSVAATGDTVYAGSNAGHVYALWA